MCLVASKAFGLVVKMAASLVEPSAKLTAPWLAVWRVAPWVEQKAPRKAASKDLYWVVSWVLS